MTKLRLIPAGLAKSVLGCVVVATLTFAGCKSEVEYSDAPSAMPEPEGVPVEKSLPKKDKGPDKAEEAKTEPEIHPWDCATVELPHGISRDAAEVRCKEALIAPTKGAKGAAGTCADAVKEKITRCVPVAERDKLPATCSARRADTVTCNEAPAGQERAVDGGDYTCMFAGNDSCVEMTYTRCEDVGNNTGGGPAYQSIAGLRRTETKAQFERICTHAKIDDGTACFIGELFKDLTCSSAADKAPDYCHQRADNKCQGTGMSKDGTPAQGCLTDEHNSAAPTACVALKDKKHKTPGPTPRETEDAPKPEQEPGAAPPKPTPPPPKGGDGAPPAPGAAPNPAPTPPNPVPTPAKMAPIPAKTPPAPAKTAPPAKVAPPVIVHDEPIERVNFCKDRDEPGKDAVPARCHENVKDKFGNSCSVNVNYHPRRCMSSRFSTEVPDVCGQRSVSACTHEGKCRPASSNPLRALDSPVCEDIPVKRAPRHFVIEHEAPPAIPPPPHMLRGEWKAPAPTTVTPPPAPPPEEKKEEKTVEKKKLERPLSWYTEGAPTYPNAASWHFPSDHLPVSVTAVIPLDKENTETITIVTYNALNRKFVNILVDKAQAIKHSWLGLGVKLNPAPTGPRDRYVDNDDEAQYRDEANALLIVKMAGEADIVCVQEVSQPLYDLIVARLPSVSYWLRQASNAANKHDFGLTIIRRTAFRGIADTDLMLSYAKDEGKKDKFIHGVMVKTKARVDFTIVNTHVPSDGRAGPENLKVLARTALNLTAGRSFVMGDFNAKLDAEANIEAFKAAINGELQGAGTPSKGHYGAQNTIENYDMVFEVLVKDGSGATPKPSTFLPGPDYSSDAKEIWEQVFYKYHPGLERK